MAACRAKIRDDFRQHESIEVAIKIAGIDLQKLRSDNKVFFIGSLECPASRLGTWALEDLLEQMDLSSLLVRGGIAMGIIWAMWRKYNEISIWIKDVQANRYILDVQRANAKSIIGEIESGRMAKAIENSLKEHHATLEYSGVRIRKIKICHETWPSATTISDKSEKTFSEEKHKKRIERAVLVGRLMRANKFFEAFNLLRKNLWNEKNEVFRLRMMIRLSICALELHHPDEFKSLFPAMIKLINQVVLMRKHPSIYLNEVLALQSLLMSWNFGIYAIQLALAFHNMVKLVQDFEKLFESIMRACSGMKLVLTGRPGANLKCEILRYLEQIEKEIQYLKDMEGCDPLEQARYVYFSECGKADIMASLGQDTTPGFTKSTFNFKRNGSCWADLPFVLWRLRIHPVLSSYLGESEFRRDVINISKCPASLEKKLDDPRISLANEVLSSNFGVMDTNWEQFNSEQSNFGSFWQIFSDGSSDNNKQSMAEKLLGNEAYKRGEFSEALSHYDAAIALDPTDAMLHSNKAAVYITQSRLNEARSSCLTAINIAQNSERHDEKDIAKITARLARVERLDGKLDIAMSLFQRSLRLNYDARVKEQMDECGAFMCATKFFSKMVFRP